MGNERQENTKWISDKLLMGIPSPGKALAKYVEDTFFWIVTTLALTLLFPFHWMTSVPVALLISVAVGAAMAASRARRSNRRRVWFRLMTLLAIVSAMAWALLGPVFIARPVLYVIIHEGWNPLSSSFNSVRVNGEIPAHLIVIADPLRKAAYTAFARRFKKVRLSVVERSDECPYVRLPSLQQLTWAEGEPGLGTRESIQVLAIANSLQLVFGLKDRVSLRFGTGPMISTLVSVEFTTSAGVPPWHGVLLGHAPGRKAFEYVVLLDLTMRAMIDGNGGDVWKLLQHCVGADPPHVIEQARALTLEARYAALACRGNLGGQQALLYANPAMELLLAHASSAKSNSRSPLAHWIQKSLAEIFDDYRAFVKTDLKPLETLQLAPFEDKRSELFSAKLAEWGDLSTSELLHRISSRQIKLLPDLIRVRKILTERIFKNMMTVLGFFRDKSEPAGGWDVLLAALEEGQQAIAVITEVARKQGAAGSANYLQPSLTWFESVIIAAKTNADDDSIERLFTSCPDAGLRSAMQTLFLQAKKGSEEMDLRPLLKSVAPSARWWEPEFQDWIRSAILRLVLEDRGENPLDSVDSLQRIVKEIPLDTFGKDTKGMGEPYLPGLFIACLISERLNEDRSKDLIAQFEKLSGLDFAKLVSAL